MRVTTQMVDISAKKTGLPYSRGSSLLDYVNQTSSGSGNTLLDALNKSGKGNSVLGQSSDINTLLGALNKTSYEKLEKKADGLEEAANELAASGEDSVFEKAKASGDNKAVYQGVEHLISNYNDTLKALQDTSDPLNEYYRQALGEIAGENAAALKNVGISVAKDGTLSLDKDKMKEADIESLEKLFGASGTFTSKAAFVASRISANAQVGMQSVSSQYNMAGNIYTASSGKYNFWV